MILLLVVVLSLVGTICATTKYNVDYQIHSNNDLDELQQLLLKGVRRFKFDSHYLTVTHKSCYKNDPTALIDTKNNADINTCFLLNHDRPSQLVDYNTLDELLEYLVSEKFQRVVKGEYVSIALCFKSAPDLCDDSSTAFHRWLREVDSFYFHASKALPSNIEIILDGDAKPFNCLNGKWPLWKSVWINEDPNPDAFTSNSADNDNYRFQVLNNPDDFAAWQKIAAPEVNYGKFSGSNYPYQLWEPDAQDVILQYKSLYLNNLQHTAGFHFAINFDVAMFRVYSNYNANANVIQTNTTNHIKNNEETPSGINMDILPIIGQSTDITTRNPLLVPIGSSSDGDVYPMLAIYTNNDSSILYMQGLTMQRSSYAVQYLEASKVSEDILSTLKLSSDNTLVKAINLDANTIMLVTRLGQVAIVTVETSMKANTLLVNNIYMKLSSPSSSPSSLLSLADLGNILDVVPTPCSSTAAASGHCFIALSQSGLLQISQVVLAEDLSSMTVITSSSVNAVSSHLDSARGVLIQSNDNKRVNLQHRGTAAADDADALMIFASSDDIISAAIVKTTTTEAVHWKQLMVGKHIDLSTATIRGVDDVLMVVNDFGYCFNAHEHNTRALPRVCSTRPESSKYTLDYSLALLADWIDVVNDSTCTTSGADCFAVNVCHDRILHGSYDLGSQPALHLVPSSSNNNTNSNVMMVELHEGLDSVAASAKDASTQRSIHCGLPRSRNSIVLDSFAVNEWVDSLLNVYSSNQ